MNDTLPVEAQRQIIEQEIRQWRANQFVLEIRHRVHKRLDNKEGIAACVSELEKCEIALAELEAVLAELNTVPMNGEA